MSTDCLNLYIRAESVRKGKSNQRAFEKKVLRIIPYRVEIDVWKDIYAMKDMLNGVKAYSKKKKKKKIGLGQSKLLFSNYKRRGFESHASDYPRVI